MKLRHSICSVLLYLFLQNKNRKVYMLFELTPSREVTGGAWYTEQDYDAEFVDVVKHQCLQYILKQAKPQPLQYDPQNIYCSPKPKSNLFKCICYQRLCFFTFQEEALSSIYSPFCRSGSLTNMEGKLA